MVRTRISIRAEESLPCSFRVAPKSGLFRSRADRRHEESSRRECSWPAISGVALSVGLDGKIVRLMQMTASCCGSAKNTAREFETVNGVKANGGSMGSGGVAVANGMLFVASGTSDSRMALRETCTAGFRTGGLEMVRMLVCTGLLLTGTVTGLGAEQSER